VLARPTSILKFLYSDYSVITNPIENYWMHLQDIFLIFTEIYWESINSDSKWVSESFSNQEKKLNWNFLKFNEIF
jgi:hypothetical protein